jgi:hypothetical protein
MKKPYLLPSVGNTTELPFLPDPSNRAGWWKPVAVSEGQPVLAFCAPGTTGEVHQIQVAQRDAAGNWALLRCYEDESKTIAQYPNDSGHRQPSIAVDGSGRLHLVGSLHTSAMNYYRDNGSGGDLFNRSEEMPDGHTTFTYPILKTAPNGDVYLIARVDEYLRTEEKRREGKLYRWENAKEQWSVIGAFAGETDRAVYPEDLEIDAAGNVHILYEWSAFPSSGFRHALSYIKYEAASGNWTDHSGSRIVVPANVAASDHIQPLLATEQWRGISRAASKAYDGPAVQTGKMRIGVDGAIHVVFRHRDTEGDVFKIKTAWTADGARWLVEEVYADTETQASLDLIVTGSDQRIYYVTGKHGRDGSAVVAHKPTNGLVYMHEPLSPGLAISHLAVVHHDGTDYVYLMEYGSSQASGDAPAKLHLGFFHPADGAGEQDGCP